MQNNIFICGIDIGNEHDFPIRSKQCLENSDFIIVEHIAEFNRRIRPKLKLKDNIEVEEFNFSMSRVQPIIDKTISLYKENKTISIIANSGMPTIYDPGIDIINGLQKENIPYKIVPGPTSLITALVASGFDSTSFAFEGDCDHGKNRIEKFNKIKNSLTESKTIIFFEVVHEAMAHTVQDMCDIFGPQSIISICINMTMPDELIFTGYLNEAVSWSEQYSNNRDTTNHNINITYVCRIVI